MRKVAHIIYINESLIRRQFKQNKSQIQAAGVQIIQMMLYC